MIYILNNTTNTNYIIIYYDLIQYIIIYKRARTRTRTRV